MTKFKWHTFFSSQDIKQNVKFSFRQLMTSQILIFTFDHPQKQWTTREKGGEDGNT